jgi:hypothetical protein
MLAAVNDYVAGVPIVALSRDPFPGDGFATSLDPHGLDGLWWAYEREYRPWVEPPPGFFAWTGALHPDGPWPDWTMKAMVGPEVPFVFPRILEHPRIKAVISSVLVGDHVGFRSCTSWTATTGHPAGGRLGHGTHTYVRPDGSPVSVHSVQKDADYDFDLGPWFDSGKLLWIAPRDASLTLRSGREGNPYLGLDGERRRRILQEGEAWLSTRTPTT